MAPSYDSVVIGGGFYGCCIALFLRRHGKRVLIIEAAPSLMQRASFVNQARIHQGYHYPRSIITGLRSRANFHRFLKDFAGATVQNFGKLYAIASHNSKVSANQFFHFSRTIGAPIRPAPRQVAKLFDTAMVEGVFEVQEAAFDAHRLREAMVERLRRAEVTVQLKTLVQRIDSAPGGKTINIVLASGQSIETPQVFNCTYAYLNVLLGHSGMPLLPLKHEVTELCLISPPPVIQRLGITVMDGPFFSTMPFPAAGLHSLSHVRFTPQESWCDLEGPPGNPENPDNHLEKSSRASWFAPMVKDASRYVPCLAQTRHVRSLYEIKTVLRANEADDGRPILFRKDYGLPGHAIVLGGKIDNIYDFFTAAQAAGTVDTSAVHEDLLEKLFYD